MRVCDFPQGRYGNAIFRYLASSLFCIIYDAKRTYDIDSCDAVMTDTDFISWSEQVLQDNIPPLARTQEVGTTESVRDLFGDDISSQDKDTNKTYLFRGYYQHDAIFLKYRDQLLEYIHAHPEDVLITDGYKPGATGIYHYPVAEYLSRELLSYDDTSSPDNTAPQYDIVVHLRLEDFVFVNQAIHPKCISDILYTIENHSTNTICFVVAKPTTPFEHKYIDYFAKRFNIICESNSPTQDYHIIKNAKTLVCSRSTMCWAAAFFSNTLETVYFPNYIATSHLHETFKTPITNTIPYDVVLSPEHEINYYLDNVSI